MAVDTNVRLQAVIDPQRTRQAVRTDQGYLDFLGAAGINSPGLGQDMMQTRFYPRVYDWWRPLAARLAMASIGQGRADEWAKAAQMLRLEPGQAVLDLCCGTGEFTGSFGQIVGADGLALGLDASPTMLHEAVRDHTEPAVAFVRGDAQDLPFRDSSFEAVCCFAALFLMAEPMRALDEVTRVLAPGGRLAIMTSVASAHPPLRLLGQVAGRVGALHVFGRDEITGALAQRGFTQVEREIHGITQFVQATAGGMR